MNSVNIDKIPTKPNGWVEELYEEGVRAFAQGKLTPAFLQKLLSQAILSAEETTKQKCLVNVMTRIKNCGYEDLIKYLEANSGISFNQVPFSLPDQEQLSNSKTE